MRRQEASVKKLHKSKKKLFKDLKYFNNQKMAKKSSLCREMNKIKNMKTIEYDSYIIRNIISDE